MAFARVFSQEKSRIKSHAQSRQRQVSEKAFACLSGSLLGRITGQDAEPLSLLILDYQ